MTTEYRVCVELPNGQGGSSWKRYAPTLLAAEALDTYNALCRRNGKDVLDVELWRKDERGEYIHSHCSLRSDLRERVLPTPEPVGEAVQLSLFGDGV